MYDTVVVGGGPIGSRVACLLAEKGHRILVLERKPRLGEKVCCTGIIGKECVDTFNIEDRVILREVKVAWNGHDGINAENVDVILLDWVTAIYNGRDGFRFLGDFLDGDNLVLPVVVE